MSTVTGPVVQKVRTGANWPVLAALLTLSLIPLVSGAIRLVEIAGGPALMPANRASRVRQHR